MNNKIFFEDDEPDNEPFGKDWISEVMKMKKIDLVNWLKMVLIEKGKYETLKNHN